MAGDADRYRVNSTPLQRDGSDHPRGQEQFAATESCILPARSRRPTLRDAERDTFPSPVTAAARPRLSAASAVPVRLPPSVFLRGRSSGRLFRPDRESSALQPPRAVSAGPPALNRNASPLFPPTAKPFGPWRQTRASEQPLARPLAAARRKPYGVWAVVSSLACEPPKTHARASKRPGHTGIRSGAPWPGSNGLGPCETARSSRA